MTRLKQIVLVRHGDTVGESRIRFHGANDVALSEPGRAQARAARAHVPIQEVDWIIASPKKRAWETAQIIAEGRSILPELDFREIDFGRWEGLTREEIAAQDPDLEASWSELGHAFDFPEGETRLAFQERVQRGLGRLMVSGDGESVLVVAHKGVVRMIAETLSGETLAPEQPILGGVLQVTRRTKGGWTLHTLLG